MRVFLCGGQGVATYERIMALSPHENSLSNGLSIGKLNEATVQRSRGTPPREKLSVKVMSRLICPVPWLG